MTLSERLRAAAGSQYGSHLQGLLHEAADELAAMTAERDGLEQFAAQLAREKTAIEASVDATEREWAVWWQFVFRDGGQPEFTTIEDVRAAICAEWHKLEQAARLTAPTETPLCRRCGLPDEPNHEFGFRDHAFRAPDDCLVCDGQGRVFEPDTSESHDCAKCDGTGKAAPTETPDPKEPR